MNQKEGHRMKTNRTYEQLEVEFAKCARGINASEEQLKAMKRAKRKT